MSKKITFEEIASAAGVSVTTVDRVINQRGGVSPKSEAKVLEWAEKLGLDRRLYRAQARTLRIAVLLPAPSNPFFADMREAFRALEGGNDDLRINCFLHTIKPEDEAGTAKKVEELSTQYDGMIICSPDHPKTSDALKRASRFMPVVTTVSDMPDSGRIAYVGPDNRKIGRAAGELMGRFLGREGGKVLVMLGYYHIIGHQEREMGFRAVLRERFPNVKIMDIAESEENSDRAAQIAQHALKSEPKVRGIYNVTAGNYEIAQTLAALGRAEDVVFITHELTARRRELLRAGMLDAVIDQNPRMEARKAIQVLAHHFKRTGSEPAPDPFTPFEIFLRENCPQI